MRRACIGVVVLLCVAFGRPLPAQQSPPPRAGAMGQTPAGQAASGVVAGTLTVADANQPVRKATVQLTSVGTPRVFRTATTDEQGRFEFTAVVPGEFTLSASKPGYLDMVYGARRPGSTSQGTVLTLLDGQRLDKISMRLPRGGVIAGMITDEFGDPAFNVPVRAIRYIYQIGYKALTAGGNAVTDDRGQYRIAGLLPGEYLVSAVPRDTIAAAAAMAEELRVRQAQLAARGDSFQVPPVPSNGYVAVYYPGSPTGAGAAPVTVGPSLEVAGIDIRLQVVQTASVTGAIVSSEAVVPQSRLQLVDRSLPMNGVGIWFRDMRPDGSFSFHGLVPGSYLLKAFGTPGGKPGMAGGEMWGAAELSVGGTGANDVQLRMHRGVKVSGQLRLEGLPAFDRTRLRVNLSPIYSPTDWEMGPVNMTPDATGAFTASNVLPALYRVQVVGLPAGWTLDSATFEEKDAADLHLPLDGSRDVVGGTIHVTSRRAEVTGSVASAAGAPVADYTVILFPSDNRLWLPQSRRIQLSQPGRDGRYAFRGLPAGDYRIAALADVEPGRQFDPAFLTELLGGAISLRLGDGESRTQELRIR